MEGGSGVPTKIGKWGRLEGATVLSVHLIWAVTQLSHQGSFMATKASFQGPRSQQPRDRCLPMKCGPRVGAQPGSPPPSFWKTRAGCWFRFSPRAVTIPERHRGWNQARLASSVGKWACAVEDPRVGSVDGGYHRDTPGFGGDSSQTDLGILAARTPGEAAP